MSTRNRPKCHHYVPTAYLERFADSGGFVHVFDRARNQIRAQRPIKLMKIDSYYCQLWAPVGIDPNIFEKILGSTIEARVPFIIDKLCNTNDSLTEDELVDLLMYLEVQRIRVPRQAASGLELMRLAMISCLSPELLSQLDNSGLQIVMKDNARFDFMRHAIGTLHPWLCRMEWEVVSSSGDSTFITSDSPVCFYNECIVPPGEAGLGYAGTKVFFPLSSTHLLIMRHQECRSLHPLSIIPSASEEQIHIGLSRGAVWDSSTVSHTNLIIAELSGNIIAARDTASLPIAYLSSNNHLNL